jgi:peptide deformylase
MAVRTMLRLEDPRLRQRAQPVADVHDAAVRQLIVDLEDTMRACSGAGLAAPQIGVPLRVVLFGGGGPNPRYPDASPVPRTVLINPVLTPLVPERDEAWEGCLSVPGLRGRVEEWRRRSIVKAMSSRQRCSRASGSSAYMGSTASTSRQAWRARGASDPGPPGQSSRLVPRQSLRLRLKRRQASTPVRPKNTTRGSSNAA